MVLLIKNDWESLNYSIFSNRRKFSKSFSNLCIRLTYMTENVNVFQNQICCLIYSSYSPVRDKAVIVIDRKNRMLPNSLISFLSPTWFLFRVLTASFSRRSTDNALLSIPVSNFCVASLVIFFSFKIS